MTSTQDLSGTREHLTSSQTRILYSLWRRFFRLCETPTDFTSAGNSTASTSTSTPFPADSREPLMPSPSSSSHSKQAGTSPSKEASTSSALPRSASSQSHKPLQRHPSRSQTIDEHGSHIPKDDKVKDELKTMEEAKEMREFLEKYGGEKLREMFWDMVKGEHPDAVMLRFLRARKWDIDRAIAVIGSTAAFRADNNVKDIIKGGELEFAKTRGALNIMKNGISYIYGASPAGEPVYFIEVGSHFSHNQTQEELKRGVIMLQEQMQVMMPPPIERKVVIFNMNDFGVRNMDWWCVFFMVKTMESYYVETLAKIYVHGAPWIFRPIWTILKPLLDPVVRDKIRLTSLPEELAEHVPFDHLPKGSMRGGLDWDFVYPMPEEDENDIQKDTETRDRYQAEYDRLAREFQASTKEICQLYVRSSLTRGLRESNLQDESTSSGSELSGDIPPSPFDEREEAYGHHRRHKSNDTAQAAALRGIGNEEDIGQDLKAKRDVLATRLRVAFLKLRPYIIGKSMQERWNALRPDGSIYWEYPKVDGTVEKQELGQGTTLHELERNLEMIDEAANQSFSNSSAAKKSTNDNAHPTTSKQQLNGDLPTALNGLSLSPKLNNDQHHLQDNNAKDTTSSPSPVLNRGNSSPSNANSGSTVTPGQDTNKDDTTEEHSSPKSVPLHPLQEIQKSVS